MVDTITFRYFISIVVHEIFNMYLVFFQILYESLHSETYIRIIEGFIMLEACKNYWEIV